MPSKKKLKRLLLAAEERAHQLDKRLAELSAEMRQRDDRIKYCPGCGKPVARQFLELRFLGSSIPTTIPGRWECRTEGCVYGPPKSAALIPAPGVPQERAAELLDGTDD